MSIAIMKGVTSSMKASFSDYISKTKQEEVPGPLTGQVTCAPPEKKCNWPLRSETMAESTKISTTCN